MTDLVERARRGDKSAWDSLVERYAPLVWSICIHHRLSPADAHDVGQGVWLRLVEQLDRLREPAALPGWLVTTTRRECQRARQAAMQRENVERRSVWESRMTMAPPQVDDGVLEAERQAALREAFADLAEPCRALLALLFHDPPMPYVTIGQSMGMPVGSIGPSRARCLDKLRRHPALRRLLTADEDHEQGDRHD